MIAGLPLTSWILNLASVGLGLAVEIHFYLSLRGHKSAESESGDTTTGRSPK
jgi:hypothetical protein